MDQNTFTGMFITSIGVLGVILVWVGSGVWKLSQTLTKLEVVLDHLREHSDGHEASLRQHGEAIHNHETRIRVLEAVTREE